jgi:hypothetical protein
MRANVERRSFDFAHCVRYAQDDNAVLETLYCGGERIDGSFGVAEEH